MAARAPTRLSPRWITAGVISVMLATVVGVLVGTIWLPPNEVVLEILDHLPFVDLDSGLTDTEAAIVWEVRFPRVVLGLLVGGLLAISGSAYQGVFRNPLADPFLLGIAAGAGLGATFAVVTGAGDNSGVFDAVPLAAFAGALLAVLVTTLLGSAGRGLSSPATLLLAGVAVAAFFTAAQVFVQQQNIDSLKQIYLWMLGSLTTVGWGEVGLLLPYFVVSVGGLLLYRGSLDVLAVGDEEARTLGMNPRTVRFAVVCLASLAAAAAVAVSGLIGFVGLVVPHAVRLVVGVSHRVVVPLAALFGGVFLVLADLIARTAMAPAELPIGVVTAFIGAPFFLFILKSRGSELT